MAEVPTVLFVCVQNAGRSQMAEALLNAKASGRARARSAGSRPAKAVHPEVAEVMREIDIDLSRAEPKAISSEVTAGVDVVVTMGCGDECPVIPGARLVDWDVLDPAGRPLEYVRTIRDEIVARVEALLQQLEERT